MKTPDDDLKKEFIEYINNKKERKMLDGGSFNGIYWLACWWH